MEDILVTVVAAMYNVEKFAAECIDSILAQTHKKLEIFLIDDGSTDGTPKICDDYAEKDSRITVIHKENAGANSCRLLGFEKSTGDYIYFIDSDDYADKTLIEKLLQACIENDAQVAVCNYYKLGDKLKVGEMKFASKTVEKCNFNEFIIKPMISSSVNDKYIIPSYFWNRLYQRSVIDRSFFVSERECLHEDTVLNYCVTDNVNRIAFVDEALYYYRINLNSLTLKYLPDKIERENRYFDFVVRFCHERNIAANDRVEELLCYITYGCIENYSKCKKYKDFKEAMLRLKNRTDMCASAGKNRIESNSLLRKIILWLFSNNCFLAIFAVKKSIVYVRRMLR